MRQFRLDRMANFMEIKSNNPKLKQSEIAKELAISTSTSQRYRRKINMHSPYRIPQSSDNHKKKQNTSNHTEHDLKMTSNDFKMTSKDDDKPVIKKVKSKNSLRGGDPNYDSPSYGRDLIEQTFYFQ